MGFRDFMPVFSVNGHRFAGFFMALLIVLQGAAPCSDSAAPKLTPEKILLNGTSVRCAALNAQVPLVLTVQGTGPSGLLGGKGELLGLEGASVRFRLNEWAVSNGASLSVSAVVTDAGGVARTDVTVGRKFGLYPVVVEAVDASGKVLLTETIRILGGVMVEGDGQDIAASRRSEHDLVVKIEREPGVPFPGIQCEFMPTSIPSGSKVKAIASVTDASGAASASLHGGDSNGLGQLAVRLMPPVDSDAPHDLPVFQCRFFVFSGWSLFLVVGLGLALFIFGMQLMSEGLRLVAGDRLRSVLEFFTRNRVTGLLVGTVVTGIIQSSSACTVMVVGFVNAGLMQLTQAISVVMGANIGTTMTAQLVSLNLSHLAAPAIMLGMIGMLVAPKPVQRFSFQILFGFGLLFFGMEQMADSLKPLKNSQMVEAFFAGLSSTPVNGVIPLGDVLWGVFIGTMITITIQSSSASIGMLIALLQAGLLDVWTAFPILLGDNIGTTITAVLACIGGNRTAKQTATAHVLFNVTGTILMVGLLFVPWDGIPVFLQLIERMTAGDNLGGENPARFIANAHSMFNVTVSMLWLPFVPILARLCRWIVRDSAKPEVRTLEPNLVSTPSLAIDQVVRKLVGMIEEGDAGLRIAYNALIQSDPKTIETAVAEVSRREADIDKHQTEATVYIQRISQKPLTEAQSVQLPRLLHAINDAERIGDHVQGLARMIKQGEKRGIAFDADMLSDMKEMYLAITDMFKTVGGNLINMDRERLAKVAACEDTVDAIRRRARKAHLTGTIEAGRDYRSDVLFLEFITHTERIGDHLLNIAQACLPPEEEQEGFVSDTK